MAPHEESKSDEWTSQPELVGATEDDFDYIRVLGGGAFGLVCLVRHKKTGTRYALKILKQEDVLKGHGLKDEANIMKKINHHLAVSLLHTFTPASYPNTECIVMDYLPGGSMLDEFESRRFDTKKRSPFTEEIARVYVAELVCIIQYLHKNGIVFRDLKPDNVMFRSSGHLCLIDFGVARKVSGHKRCATRIGADGFKAPEVISIPKVDFPIPDEFAPAYDGFAVDWWNLGILMYLLLKGKHPFRKKFNRKGLDKAIIARQKKIQKKTTLRKRDSKSADSSPTHGTRRLSQSLASLFGSLGRRRSTERESTVGLRQSQAEVHTEESDEEQAEGPRVSFVGPRVSFVKGGGKLMAKPIEGVSNVANELVLSLLESEPKQRMRNTQNIRDHPFFRGIDWDMVDSGSHVTPGLLPSGVLDTLAEGSNEASASCEGSNTTEASASCEAHMHKESFFFIREETPAFQDFGEMMQVVERSKQASLDII